MKYNQFIIQTLNKFKRKSPIDFLTCIPIYNDSQKIVAFLKPITFDFQVTMPTISQKITKWKKENPFISASTMKLITTDMTIQWIIKYLLQREDKLIFMIDTLQFGYAGYIGLAQFNWQKEECQIDSVLRGQKHIIPGLMSFCIKALIKFGFNFLKLKSITLDVDGDNIHAINFYKKIGFIEMYRIPLQLIKISEQQERLMKNEKLNNYDKYSIKMKYMGGTFE